jgi:circadian clock protein KaiC
MLMRLIDFLKSRQVTLLLTSLTAGGEALERSDAGVSSLVDSWILLRDIDSSEERHRGIYILKSRGMAHSNQIREFHLTGEGIRLTDVSRGAGGAPKGSARPNAASRRRPAAASPEAAASPRSRRGAAARGERRGR